MKMMRKTLPIKRNRASGFKKMFDEGSTLTTLNQFGNLDPGYNGLAHTGLSMSSTRFSGFDLLM